MSFGSKDKKIIDDCYRSGRPVPPKIKNAPVLGPGLSMYFTAFNDLTTCRGIGFGPGPIPWMAMDRYCQRLLLRGPDRSDFLYLMREMDNAYLQFQSDQMDKARTNGGGPIGGK